MLELITHYTFQTTLIIQLLLLSYMSIWAVVLTIEEALTPPPPKFVERRNTKRY